MTENAVAAKDMVRALTRDCSFIDQFAQLMCALKALDNADMRPIDWRLEKRGYFCIVTKTTEYLIFPDAENPTTRCLMVLVGIDNESIDVARKIIL